MPTVSINNVGQFGIVADRFPQELPLNAWTDGRNVRARNGFMEKYLGHTAIFGTPSVAPYNIQPVVSAPSTYLWVYTGLTKVYVWNGAVHTDITRLSGDYTATADQNWTITNFQGLPVLNNAFDKPQVWSPVSIGQRLVDLPNWNATWLAQSVRAYKQFLVALNMSKAGNSYPLQVKWSHPAASGAVPNSWDETDATKDAGEYDLADTDGHVIDGLPLRDIFVIYKEDAIWGMQFVGGNKVMRFFKLFDGVGVFGHRCAVEFFLGKHLVFGSDDIFIHDGQNRQSVLDDKMRRTWFSIVTPETFDRSFVVVNAPLQEVWCCTPTGSAQTCNLALVWNWKDNTLTIRELPDVAGGVPGVFPTTTQDIWDPDVNTWDSDSTIWDDRLYNPLSRRVIFARPSAANILLADDTNTFEGVNMTAYIERTGLGIPFRVDQPPDFSSMKFMTAVWPRIEGTAGGVVKVYVGTQQKVDGAVTYQSPVNFTIGTTTQVPVRASGRLFALKFESTTNIDWRLHGYDLDVKKLGRF